MTEENGFSLVELMITVAISGVIIAAVYTSYTLQRKTSVAQEQVAAMQQNLRAGMLYLTRDLRHAGADLEGNTSHASCDAGGSGSAVSPGFHTATSTTIGFSMDLDEDGACDGTGENVTYNLYTSDGVQKLGRKSPSINAAIAEHIEEI